MVECCINFRLIQDVMREIGWQGEGSAKLSGVVFLYSAAAKPARAERALLAKIQTCIGLPRFIFRIAARRISLLISTPFAAGRGAGKVSGTRAPRRRLN